MSKPESQPTTTHKQSVVQLRSVTGLRFVAAFAVFYSHIQDFLFPEVRRLALGASAVSFFFVLSGFILTYVYSDRLTRSETPRFLVKRIARLWPLHLVCLGLAVWFLRVPPGASADGQNSIPSLVAQFFLLQSWVPIGNWFLDFNSVSWSISTELFFYLLFPLLLLGNRSAFWWKLFFAIGIAIACLFGMQALYDLTLMPSWVGQWSLAIAFPVIRLAEFVVGMMACRLMHIYQSKSHSRVEFRDESPSSKRFLFDTALELLCVGLIVFTWRFAHYSGIYKYLANSPEFGALVAIWFRISSGTLIYALTILVFATRCGLLGRLLGSRVGVWLGEISFAFYLIHQIVIVQLNQLALSDFYFSTFSFSISLLASALLFRVIEIPLRDGLVALYDRRHDWLKICRSGLESIVRTKSGIIQVAVLIVLLLIVAYRPVDEVKEARCQEIVASTPERLRGIVFQDEATLLGTTARRVERGVEIKMVWNRQHSWSRKRFLHICDPNGKILAQHKLEHKLFKIENPNRPFLDEVVIPKRKLKDAAYIAVGFWSEEMQCARVDRAGAEMSNSRYSIVQLPALTADFVEP